MPNQPEIFANAASNTSMMKSASAAVMHIGGAKRMVCPQAAFAEQQAHFAGGFVDGGAFGFAGLFGRAVFYDFHAEHQALATHIADELVFVLQFSRPVLMRAPILSEFSEVFLLDDLEHGLAHRADDWVAAEGVEVNFAGAALVQSLAW